MWTVRYLSVQSVLYSVGQFLLLFLSWYGLDSSEARPLSIYLSLIVVIGLPLLPLLRLLTRPESDHIITKWARPAHFLITAIFLCGILSLEYVLGHRFSLVPSVILNLLFKLVMGDTILDILALFIAYTASAPVIAKPASLESLLPVLTMLALLGVVLGLAATWNQLTKRISNYARVMRLVNFRHDLELKVTEYIIGKKLERSPTDENFLYMNSQLVPGDMLREAASTDLFSLPRGYASDIVNLRSAERHLTVIIVVKQCITEEHESIQNSIMLAYIHRFLDELAKVHKITPVRKFRGLWIGSLGFFDTWDQSRLNSCHVVQMASELVSLSKRFGWQLCSAIDQGSIIGGYIGEQMNFEMLGPEVKWAISTVDETHSPHEICVSPAVRNVLMSNAVLKSGIFSVDVTFRTIKTKMSEAETLYVIDNASELIKQSLDEIYAIHNNLSLETNAPIDWDLVHRIWGSDSLGFFSRSKVSDQASVLGTDADDSTDYGHETGRTSVSPSQHMSTRAIESTPSLSSAGSMAYFGKSTRADFRSGNSVQSVRRLDSRPGTATRRSMRSDTNISDEQSDAGDMDGEEDSRSHATGRSTNKSFNSKLTFRPVNSEVDCGSNNSRTSKTNYERNRTRKRSFFQSPIEYITQVTSPNMESTDLLEHVEKIYFGSATTGGPAIDGSRGISQKDRAVELNKTAARDAKDISSAVGILVCKHLLPRILQFDCFPEVFAGIGEEVKMILYSHESPKNGTDEGEGLPNPFGVLLTLLKELPLVIMKFATNASVSTWCFLYYFFMNEPFDINEFPYLIWVESKLSDVLAKMVNSRVYPILSEPSTKVFGSDNAETDRALFRSSLASARTVFPSTPTPRRASEVPMTDPIVQDTRFVRKSEVSSWRDNMLIITYCEESRKRIGLNLLILVWVLSLCTIILATHVSITSAAASNAPAYSFQYLGVIYIVCLLLLFEQAMKKKLTFVAILLAKLLLVVYYPLYLVTEHHEGASTRIDPGDPHRVRHLNAVYLVFVHMLLGSFVRPLRYAYVECFVISAGILLRYPISDGHNQRLFNMDERVSLLAFFVPFTIIANLMLEFYITVSFVLECVLVPHATASMLQQHDTTRSVLSIFIPSVTPEVGIRLMNNKRYGNCAIITMHVKPYQSLPSLVNAREAAAFLLLFHKMLDACFEECGFVRVCRFSGVFVAITSDDADFGQNLSKMHHNASCRRRALLCARYVQKRLEAFNRTYKVNAAVGVSIMSGSLALGVTNSKDIALSVSGSAVSIGSMFAVREADNIIVDETFAMEARKTVSSHIKKFSESIPGSAIPAKFYSLVLEEGSFGGQGRKLNDFTYLAMLGRGGYGSVHLVNDKYGIKYAVKCIPKRKGGAASDNMITREFLILTQMKHPNVMALKYCIMNESCVYLVMEYVRGGNLKQIIEKYEPDLNTMTLWFAELVLAIEYVHSLGIQHRDVKPVNCMIHTDGHLKLGDFGLAKIVRDDVNSNARADDISESSESDDTYGDQIFNAISIMQKVLPIRHHTTHVEGGAQISGLIQALVVDADVVRGIQTCSVLKNMMVEAVFYESAKETWKVLNDPKSSIDLILLDLGPNLEGPDWTLFKDLRTNSISESIPVIALSAYDLKSMEDGAIEQGAKMFILHPLDANVHRDAIFNCGMIRRQWKYEESGEDSTVSRQMIGSSGMSAAAVTRRYSGSPTRAVSLSSSSPKVSQNFLSNKTLVPSTPSGSRFPSSEIAKNLSALKSSDAVPVVPKLAGLIMKGPSDAGSSAAEKAPDLVPKIGLEKTESNVIDDIDEPKYPSPSPRILLDDVMSEADAPKSADANSNRSKDADDENNGDIASAGEVDSRAMFRSVVTAKNASGSFNLSGNFAAMTGKRPPKNVPLGVPVAATAPEQKSAEKKPAAELNSAVGTAHFMAPEIITERIYDKSVDWWACGITFYYCVTRVHLFRGSDPNAIFRNILKADIDLSKLDPISLDLKSLIAGLLDRDYKKRFGSNSTKDIKEHPFFCVPDFDAVCSRSPTLQPQQLEEVTVTQADKDTGEELFFNRKTLKKKVRVTTTSFSTNMSGDLGRSRRSKSGSLGSRKSKKLNNMKRFNRVANSIRDYSIAEEDENDDSEGESHQYESAYHKSENNSLGGSMLRHSEESGTPDNET